MIALRANVITESETLVHGLFIRQVLVNFLKVCCMFIDATTGLTLLKNRPKILVDHRDVTDMTRALTASVGSFDSLGSTLGRYLV